MLFVIGLVSTFGIVMTLWQLRRETLKSTSYSHLQTRDVDSEHLQEYDFEEAIDAIQRSDEQLRNAVEELLQYRSYTLL